jgi:hypothetical protein
MDSQHKWIVQQAFQIEGDRQRQQSIQQQVQGMISADLTLACQIKAAIYLRRPVERLAASEAVGIKRSHREVECTEIIRYVDTAGEKRTGQREHQTGG